METHTLAAGKILSRRTLVIAHRGDSREAPENTLPAFASAVKLGVDFVELDYYHSADGVPVVFHDKELDRHTDACRVFGEQNIPIGSKTLAELRRLDAGSWFAPHFAGTRIPTLDEALDTIHPRSLTMIERKAGDAATCLALLKKKGRLGDVIVQAFDWDYLADFRRLSSGVMLGALGEKELTDAQLDQIVALQASVVGWKNEDLTREYVQAVHRRRLKVWVWTVDDPRRAAELIDWGVDGLISNVPAAIQRVAAEHPRPAP